MKIQKYKVTMQYISGTWEVYVEANSKFNAMLIMTKKYISQSAMAIDAVVDGE